MRIAIENLEVEKIECVQAHTRKQTHSSKKKHPLFQMQRTTAQQSKNEYEKWKNTQYNLPILRVIILILDSARKVDENV